MPVVQNTSDGLLSSIIIMSSNRVWLMGVMSCGLMAGVVTCHWVAWTSERQSSKRKRPIAWVLTNMVFWGVFPAEVAGWYGATSTNATVPTPTDITITLFTVKFACET